MIGWQAAYAQARQLEKKDDWAAAAKTYARLVRLGEDTNPRVVFRLGHAYFRLNRLDESLPLLEKAVELQPTNAAWNYRLGFVLERKKSFDAALFYYRKALELDPRQASWVHRVEVCEAAITQLRLDLVSRNRGATWQILSVLEEGLPAHANDPQWLEKLGDAYFKMGRSDLAGSVYTKAATLRPESADLQFKAGWALEVEGKAEQRDTAYERAVTQDTSLGSPTVGVGAFFQAKGQWKLAAKHYAKTLQSKPDAIELYYRLGLAQQKIYDWAGAAGMFRKALELDPFQERLSWRLGLSYERLGDLQSAEIAYSRVLKSTATASHYWKYRMGYVLQLQGRYRDACIAFYLSREDKIAPSRSTDGDPYLERVLKADLEIGKRSQSAELSYKLGLRAEELGYPAIAAAAYSEAVQRTLEYDPERYFRLGRALMLSGMYREASAAFLETRQFKRPHAVDTTQYMKNKHQKQAMAYTEYMETLDILDSTILYESAHGSAVAGSPLQVCKSVIMDTRFSGFRHVWVVNDLASIPGDFKRREDFIFVTRDSDLYLRYLATARFLINDNTFPPYFIRRNEQQYLNTWHGTPLKTLGRDIKNGVMEHKNAARNFLHATHLIAPNKFTADCLVDRYDVAGIFNGRLAITGYPRVDATLTATDDHKAELRKQLGVPPDKKVVLYAPTWRGTLGDRILDNSRLVADVEALAGSDDWHFLFRGHAMTSAQTDGKSLHQHVVPPIIDTNDLLSIVDVLITDYSSIFFDFIATGRPIIYYAYDLEQYKAERGLYFDLASMPGNLCYDVEAVVSQISEAIQAATEHEKRLDYISAEQEFCPLDDGGATARAIDFFFFGSSEYEVHNGRDGKRNVLFYQGSFLPNGITTSYLNLVSHVDPDQNNIYVVVDPDALASEAARLEKFEQNPEHVRVLARVGSHVLTPEERWVVDKFNTQHTLDSDEMWIVFNRAFAREFRRMFGTASFDSVICFEGYARFWTALLGNAPLEGAKKSVYLHNDMYNEWRNRFEYLEANFRLYKNFESLVSVTESVAEENTTQLAERFELDSNKFTFCNNLVNPAETLHMAEQPLDEDIAQWVDEGDTLFVTLGRLSPEKGHAKLICAFSEIAAEQSGAKLVILGDGPLHSSLQELITRLDLDGCVLLAGRRLNPFAILANADCFVFSSDYEGQGLVVLEALILDRPVISTDVVGPRSVLEGGYGLLVENSVDGLTGGFRSFFLGQVPRKKLDYELYQKEALDKFGLVVL
ncbi:CDP-glycerol glycerophosphotransferase family protein [Arthrobacter jiangjiafuii]|uniref:CDP-glycerol glycerophosphotransferase family protein n=1 Tax=Arthrobacter jiangjiafuii TaxID=2817475 RepID=A0A975R062_9MICC|nr:CDP-glycerol glycerophosphotransferase family protein [Arthrobacter jiangjiafuii]MBP3043602.1 CDP-glycerol glycerophosphotransferase family protein [Arthrobacter jiangjiafuii]QWC09111.1 CDP-glycerol glycerophosphotransferase family protein [Arthrobacter jiangjiafuii]